ncbi:MAG: TIGR00266 family protein [Chloroflexota bacterium]|jgi:uncharacterized protein (TIGR00266 family)
MKVDVQYRPSFALAVVTLEAKESIQVESGAMVGMSPDLEMETEARGGFLKSLTRSMFGGESFFLNTYTASSHGDSVALAPPLPGDISVIEMRDETLMVQSGSYLASSEGIEVNTKWSGAKTFFGSEGLIMLRISGTGTLIVSSYGAIHPMELEAGQSYVVDTGHLVTFEEHLDFRVKKVSGWKSTLFSGEGLVVELTGPGQLTLQSRSQDSFLSWLIPQLPTQTSNN